MVLAERTRASGRSNWGTCDTEHVCWWDKRSDGLDNATADAMLCNANPCSVSKYNNAKEEAKANTTTLQMYAQPVTAFAITSSAGLPTIRVSSLPVDSCCCSQHLGVPRRLYVEQGK